MTEQLYYQDSYIKDFEAVVLSCIPNGNHFEAVLDRTAFFPEAVSYTHLTLPTNSRV